MIFWFYFWILNFELLFVFWLTNRPSIKYVRNWKDGRESSKMFTSEYRGRGVSLPICTNALTDNYFFHFFVLKCLVHTIKRGCFFIYSNLHKKEAFDFLKQISYTIVCLKFLCDTKLIMPLLILWFLVKNWNENRIYITIHSGITYFCIWLFDVAKYQGGDEAEARDTDEQPLSVKPLLIWYGEIYSAWQ